MKVRISGEGTTREYEARDIEHAAKLGRIVGNKRMPVGNASIEVWLEDGSVIRQSRWGGKWQTWTND